MFKVAVLVLALIATASVSVSVTMRGLSYDNCNGTWPIMLTYLSVGPDPLTIPGPAYFNVSLTGTKGVVSPSPGKFVVTYHNETTGIWDKIPCIGDQLIPIGSCDYDDVCSILTAFFNGTDCPPAFVSSKVPCNCPFNAGSYNLIGGELYLNKSIPLPSGDYNFNLNLFDSVGGQLGCINIGGHIVNN